MDVMITAFKSFQGKVKEINKKEVPKGENFSTPPCEVSHIPEGTVYYEIILEKEILKSEVKLTFFGNIWGIAEKESNLEKEIVVGKNSTF